MVKEKIQKELMNMSPNLCREIKTIRSNQNDTEVIFHNGSSFVTTACNDEARGARSTVLIVDWENWSHYIEIYKGKFGEFGSELATVYE